VRRDPLGPRSRVFALCHGIRIVRSSLAIRWKSVSKVMSSAPASIVAAAIQISLTGIGVPGGAKLDKQLAITPGDIAGHREDVDEVLMQKLLEPGAIVSGPPAEPKRRLELAENDRR